MSSRRPAARLAALLCLLLPGLAAATDQHTQSVVLEPGWNAVWLEVAPPDPDPAVVFAGLPVESVWAWNPRHGTIEFVADPSEPILQETGWLGWFEPGRPEAFLSKLRAIQVNRPFLILLGGTSAETWEVTGRPSLRSLRWLPSSFNLVGFPLDAAATAPTFGDLFASSPAHAGQPVYRLDPGGAWRLAAPAETLRDGEAFWVYTLGASDFDGPLEIELPVGDSLDFGSDAVSSDVFLTNRSAQALTFGLSLLSETGGPNVLEVEELTIEVLVDETVFEQDWEPLNAPLSLPAAPGEEVRVRLGVRRTSLTQPSFEGLLEITDGGGGRRLLAVAALDVGVELSSLTGGSPLAVKATTHPYGGLWVGTAELNRVSEVHHADTPTTPTDADSTFLARLIVHVDETGQAALLKEVIQMREDVPVEEEPGAEVLVIDPARIPEFKGITLRGETLFARRLSSAFLDYPGLKILRDSGSFETGETVDFTIDLPADHPTNPFRHRFHADHDEDAESFDVTRAITLTFYASDPLPDPDGDNRPDWQTSRVEGDYAETLSGLHYDPLYVAGTFTLQRVSEVEVLQE